MNRRATLVAATAALGVAAGALPSAASAAPKWRCTATPLAGTVLGQPLNLPSAGSAAGECEADSTLPTLRLPDPLSSLLQVDFLNGVTNVTDAGAFAGAGLASVKVGSLPIPLDEIPIPDELKRIEVTLPGEATPVAAVDLTPAIEALQNIPSRDLLDVGVLYSNVTGTCQDGAPVVTGGSRVLNASVLGLPVDASKTVDTAVNLVDTAGIALDTLDLKLAKVTLLGGTVDVSTGEVLEALKPLLSQLPPIAIPPQLAHVKLTASSQEQVDGMLVQRALRVQVSLAGRSIADLSVGQAAVGAGDACKSDVPRLALECTTRKLTLIDVLPQGDRVRLFGAADERLAGKVVRIVFKATGDTVAKVRVKRDGTFETTAPMPSKDVRHTNRARYIAKAAGEKSFNLKLMRRMVMKRITSKGGKVTLEGRVIRPLAEVPKKITVKRRVSCESWQTLKRVKPDSDGSFKVTVRAPRGESASVYRLSTKVRQSLTNPKLYPTFTLPRPVDLF